MGPGIYMDAVRERKKLALPGIEHGPTSPIAPCSQLKIQPTFRRNMSPPSAGSKCACYLLSRWRLVEDMDNLTFTIPEL
jgi:hypothetical protein